MKQVNIKQNLLLFSILIKLIVCFQTSYLRLKTESPITIINQDTNDSNKSPSMSSFYKGHCFVKINNFFYDLNPLNTKNGYFVLAKNGQTVSFNFCQNIPTQCEKNEGLVVSTARCRRYAGLQKLEKIWIKEQDTKQNTILTLKLPEGDICERNRTSIIRYQTIFQITCDQDTDYLVTNPRKFSPSKCVNTIKIKSKYGKISSKISL